MEGDLSKRPGVELLISIQLLRDLNCSGSDHRSQKYVGS